MNRYLLVPALLLSALQVSTAQAQPNLQFNKGSNELGPAVSVVEKALLEGSFASGLSVSFSGKATPRVATVEVLRVAGATLSGCTGNALLSRRQDLGEQAGRANTYQLTPLGTRFSLRCELQPSGAQVRVEALDGVLLLESAVSDGEFFASNGAMELVPAMDQAQAFPVTISGKYRIIAEHAQTRFVYVLRANNPNRSPRSYRLRLRSKEELHTLESRASWQLEDGEYVFELPPGSTEIGFEGRLTQENWLPPIDAPRQSLLFSSHPLLELNIRSKAALVSPQEAGFGEGILGAQAFLLKEGQGLSWTLREVETLPTTSFAVNSAWHTLFVGRDGELVGSSKFEVNNQGESALLLPMRGQPIYAGIDNSPSYLSRDEMGHLRLPMRRGKQQVEVQYAQKLAPGAGFLWTEIAAIPRVDATVPSNWVELRVSEGWQPLYQSSGADRKTPLGALVWVLLFALWTERCLLALGLGRTRFSLALLFGLLAVGSSDAMTGVVLLLSGVSLLWLIRFLRRLKLTSRWLIVPLSFALAVAALIAFIALNDRSRTIFGAGAQALAGSSDVASDKTGAPPQKTKAARPQQFSRSPDTAASPTSPSELEYRGLPAKIYIPYGTHQTTFRSTFLPSSHGVKVQILLISQTLVNLWLALLCFLALTLLIRERRVWLAGLKAMLLELGHREESGGRVETSPG